MEESRRSHRLRCSSVVVTQQRSSTKYQPLSANYPRSNKLMNSGRAVSSYSKKSAKHSSSSTSTQNDEELLHLFIQRIRNLSHDLVKVWNIFSICDDPEKRVLLVHFKLILDHICGNNDEQMFQRLINYLEPQSPHAVCYRELVTKLLKQQTLTTNAFYEYFDRTTPLEEMEIELRNRLVKNVTIVCKLFLALDRKKTGLIHISELRKIAKYCCQLTFSETAFNKILLRYDPRHSEFIDYRDFLKRLAINVSIYYKTFYNLNMRTALAWPDVKIDQFDGHQKRLAILKGENEQEIKDLNLEEIYKKLQSKVWEMDKLLAKGFLVLDYNSTGRVPWEAFRVLLSHFTVALSTTTFNQILAKIDVPLADYIEWKSCLEKLKGNVAGIKYLEPDQQITTLDTKQHNIKSDRIYDLPIVDQVSRVIHQCDSSHGPQLLYHFNYKIKNQPCITRQELKAVLAKLGIRINQQQFKQLTVILDPDHTNLIPYDTFTQIFDGSIPHITIETLMKNERNDRPPLLFNQISNSRASSAQINRITPWSVLLTKLKEKVHDNYDNIEKVLRSCDYQSQGLICSSQLKRLIDNFCFKLSNDEYAKVLHQLQDVDGMINIRRFNNIFYQSEKERLQRWSFLVDNLTKFGSPHLWTNDQLDNIWTQLQVTFGKKCFSQLKQLQEDTRGLPSKQLFHSLVCSYTGWLYDEEYDYIWNTYLCPALHNLDKLIVEPETKLKDNVDETEAEKVQSGESERALTPANSNHIELPTHHDTKTNNTASTIREILSAKRRPKTLGPCGFFAADLSLRQILANQWFEIKRRCMQLDVKNNFTISAKEFIDILKTTGVPVTSRYLQKILQLRYNVSVQDPNAPVKYVKFLTNLFLTCQHSKKLLPDKIGSILLDLRKPILSQWKILKKSFYRNDVMGTGNITVPRFLATLKQHEVKLNDEEINQLTKYLDPQITGTIRYKDFLHIFMKSVV